MKKIIIALALLFPITVGAFYFNPVDLSDGSIIRAKNNPDVYIVKIVNGKKYKRLVLNEKVFASYGHLKWENIIALEQYDMDSFVDSSFVKVDGDINNTVYRLIPNGDSGRSEVVKGTIADMDSVYLINKIDFANYEATTEELEITGYKNKIIELEEKLRVLQNSYNILDKQNTGNLWVIGNLEKNYKTLSDQCNK